MDNKEEKKIDPNDPLGIKNITGDLSNMVGFTNSFSTNIRSTLQKIRDNPDLTPEQKTEMESKINESGIEENLGKLKVELDKLKDHGATKPK